jgi:hypothetical protein
MITLTLTRTSKTDNAVRGSIVLPFTQYPCSDREEKDITIKTLENADFIIPAGTYPLKRTYSYKFKKLLPILEDVPDREGIRIHRGTKPEHSEGCILTDMYGQSTLDIMLNRLNEFYHDEEIFLRITSSCPCG